MTKLKDLIPFAFKVLDLLPFKGWRNFIMAAIIATVKGLEAAGKMSPETANWIAGMALAALGYYAGKHADEK